MEYFFVVELAEQDSFEPNDAIADTTLVSSGDHVNGTIATGDEDVFAIEADAYETITAAVALRDTKTVNQGNIAIDILNANGERLNDPAEADGIGGTTDLTNSTDQTIITGTGLYDAESVNVTVEEAGTYYVRVQETPGSDDFFDIGGFLKYGLDIETSGVAETPTETSDDTDALVIIGGTPENKVTYEFTYEGDIERSGESHGAPIEDRHVTIDRDIDIITDSHVSGRLGGGGDAYLVTGEITGFELDGDASVYLNGREVGPATFGGVNAETTATATSTSTDTPTETATPTPTAVPTSTPTPTETRTATRTVTTPTAATTPTTAVPMNTTPTESETTHSTEQNGRILGGTETSISKSSGPGFGFAVALVSLLVAGLLAARYDRE